MADFTTNTAEVPSGGPTPVAPVSNTATASAIQSVSGVLSGVGVSLANASIASNQQKAEAANTGVLENLVQNVRRHSDLVAQGYQSSDAAYRRIRVLVSQVEAAHPGLGKQIRAVVNEETSARGLSSNLVDGTKAEQDQHALSLNEKQEATKAGFIHPEDDLATQAVGLHNYREFNLGQQQIGLLQKQQDLRNAQLQEQSTKLSMANASVSLQKNRLQLQEERDRITYNKGFSQSALGLYANAQKDIKKINDDPNTSVDDKVAQVGALKDMYMSKATGDALAAGKDGVPAAIAQTFNNLFQTNQDILTGKFQGDNAKAHLDGLIQQSQNAILSADPAALQITALGTKIGAIDDMSRTLIASKVASMVLKGAQLPPPGGGPPSSSPVDLTHNNDEEKRDAKDYTDRVKGMAGDVVANKKMPDYHRDQTQTMINSALDSMYRGGSTAASPADLQVMVNMFASKELGLYLSNPKHGVDQTLQDKAKSTYETYYKSKIVPLIRDEFDTTTIKVGDGPARNNYETSSPIYAPTNSQVGAVYQNGTVSFQFIGPSQNMNQELQQTVVHMNKTIAPVLNTAIRAWTHLHGTTNYDPYAHEILTDLFPKEESQAGVQQ